MFKSFVCGFAVVAVVYGFVMSSVQPLSSKLGHTNFLLDSNLHFKLHGNR